ncbi:MAG: helix-turn-helix domain-containing protein, partial [Planctomycetota bacterium]
MPVEEGLLVDSFEYLRAVARSGLPRGLRDYLRTLLTWADLETWECWPSQSTIADAMGIDRRSAQRHSTELRRLGIIEEIGAMQSGQLRVRILVDRLDSLANNACAEPQEVGHDVTGGEASCRRGGDTESQGVGHDVSPTDQRTEHRTDQQQQRAARAVAVAG